MKPYELVERQEHKEHTTSTENNNKVMLEDGSEDIENLYTEQFNKYYYTEQHNKQNNNSKIEKKHYKQLI